MAKHLIKEIDEQIHINERIVDVLDKHTDVFETHQTILLSLAERISRLEEQLEGLS